MSYPNQLLTYCKKEKIRYAGKRMSVAEQLSLQRDFVDGDTLWCLMRNTGVKVSRATVYGALKWLTALGFAERKVIEDKKTLFKLRKRRVELRAGEAIAV